MLIALYIASQVSKAADSLRRIEEEDEYHSGIDAIERFFASGRKKRLEMERIKAQLGEIPKTPRETPRGVDIDSDDDPYLRGQTWI